MAAVNDVPQLVDKKGDSYAAIAPKLEPRKFNKWKKRMLCYLAGMKPYYLKYERRVVIQDQRFKSKIMSSSPDDIMESCISCVSAKETWTNLVYNFEGPSDSKENRIMDLKLEYQTFRAKSTASLSQTYTRYKSLLNELANDSVNLSGSSVSFVTSLSFSTTGGGIGGPSYETPLRVVIALASFLGFGMVLLGKELELEDYKAEYKKMKAKLALLEASPMSSQNPKTFQPENKGLVVETYIGGKIRKEEVSIEEVNSESKIGKLPKVKQLDLNGELFTFTESSSKMNENENLFVPASKGYDQEMVPKTKDWVERLNPNSKLRNSNTGRILVPESQAINESIKPTETLNTHESSKDSKAESFTPQPPLKNL
ncbi:hypothetical protein Tco_0758027 [Tanacetum coccineum]